MELFKGSVWIVDNEEPISRMLLHTLSGECYYCVTASSGQDALDKSAVSDFDAVLLNALMPGMSGIEVLLLGTTLSP